jgi:L-threonylcarbamoyladenylate synthase
MRARTLGADDPTTLPKAIEIIGRGGLVAFPTDTVYGVGGGAFDERAAERLYQVKGRPGDKPIPVLVGDVDDLALIASELRPEERKLVERFWPGPLTLVVHRVAGLPSTVTPFETVGVRIPDHPVALALLRAAGPMAVTSANRSGATNSMTAGDVRDQLGDRIELIIDGGRCPGGAPSTVAAIADGEVRILRQGPLDRKALEAALR